MKTLKAMSAKQKGFNLMQFGMVAVLTVAGLAAGTATYQSVSADSANTQAFEEFYSILNQMQSIGNNTGHDYTGLVVADLIAETSIEDAVNVYGLTFSVAVATGDWALTFPFPDASSCSWVEARVGGHPGLNAAAPACDVSNNLVATVE